ncbi:Phospholipase [Salix suchowensis]|nr:Phospholipase [Salix suchowensis]
MFHRQIGLVVDTRALPSPTSAHYPEWRLDRLLKRKAEQGVKIMSLYTKRYVSRCPIAPDQDMKRPDRKVTQTMSMSSKHTKRVLSSLHPNVLCIRHPDHIGSKGCSCGQPLCRYRGLDLCFGRWDTNNHPLADVHPADFSRTLFPGQDYNNARIQDFQNVYEYASNTLSILESARMPWHDVHMTMTGPAVLDVVQHFVERWNEIKKRKATLIESSGTRWGGDSRIAGMGLEARVMRTKRMRTTTGNTNTRGQRTAASKSCAAYLIGLTVRNGPTPMDSVLTLRAVFTGVLNETSIQNACE